MNHFKNDMLIKFEATEINCLVSAKKNIDNLKKKQIDDSIITYMFLMTLIARAIYLNTRFPLLRANNYHLSIEIRY